MRGRQFRGAGKTLHYVGTMFPGAQRTRARRMTASAFHKGVITNGPDGQPTTSTPIPDDLKSSFVDAFWHSLAWRDTTWLGHRVAKAPTDLVAYQEIVERVRPDWIVETGTANGGRALFLASICDLLGHGQSRLDRSPGRREPRRASAHHLHRGPGPGGRHLRAGSARSWATRRTRSSCSARSPARTSASKASSRSTRRSCRVNSYVIVENTIVNGHPVWPGFGPGPLEAVKRILSQHGEFAADTAMEKFGLTFNPNGFLKRMK